MRIRILLAVVIALVVAGTTWFRAERQTVPVTGREQRVGLSDQQQDQLGLQVFDQTLAEQQQSVVRDGPQAQQVERVARRIISVARGDRPEFNWRVAVIDSPDVNAFCLPGGKIVVYTGILDVARNDAGLATVIGHEVAHAVAEHGAERVYREQLTSGAVSAAAGTLAEDSRQYQQLAGLLGAGAQVGLSLPWGRGQESEADHIGLIYMARAGYDPAEAIGFWERMAAATGGAGQPEYTSTHPSHGTRIRQIRGWLPEARTERRDPTDDTVEGVESSKNPR